MQPDASGNAGGGANPRPKLPPVAAAPASSGRPASVLPHKTANVRDHYRIGKKLGQGQFGTTYLCVAKEDGGEFACKSIPKRKLLARVGAAARAALLLPVLIKAGERRGTASHARWRGLRRDHRGVFLASPSR